MTPMCAATLFLVVLTLATSAYDFWCYAQAYKRRRSNTSGLIALIAVVVFIVGTFYGLVWWIQLAGGYAPMWFRNTWRTGSLVFLASIPVFQAVILNIPNKRGK